VYFTCLHLGHNLTSFRYSLRRLRRPIPSAKIVVCLWGSERKDISKPDVLVAEADACAVSFAEALSVLSHGREANPAGEPILEPASDDTEMAKSMGPVFSDELVHQPAL
jgi:hypothetical protein